MKSFNISSAGLKNIVFESDQEDEFVFIFNENNISMKTIFAEFISPEVSKLHRSDPTATSISFTKQLKGTTISNDLLTKFKLLSAGESISMSEEETIQMSTISLLIGNEELFNKIADIYLNDCNETNINHFITNLTFSNIFSPFFDRFDINKIINFISSHFYLIEHDKLIRLPKHILLSIISNPNLKLNSEDSLFEFIIEIFKEDDMSKTESDTDVNIISFFEQLEFSSLSDESFEEFIESIDPTEISNELWRKLCRSFNNIKKNSTTSHKNRYFNHQVKNRYIKCETLFSVDKGPFNGIIDYLTKKSDGNVSEKGVVKVTSSSIYKDNLAKNAVDLYDNSNHFQTNNFSNSWLKLDFIENKIYPTHYSIKSRCDTNLHQPKNWVIEGSNVDSNDDDDWTLLDKRSNDCFLNSTNVTHTYEITRNLDSCDGFRFIRIRHFGPNANNCNYLAFSAIEFFGELIEVK